MSNVKVLTFLANDIGGNAESDFVIDYTQADSRKWLGRHSGWALTNGFAVLSYPTMDPVTYAPVESLNLDRLKNNPNFRVKDSRDTEQPVATETPVVEIA